MEQERRPLKEIPKGKVVIQILSDDQEQKILDEKIRQSGAQLQIQQAILSKDLNLMKIAIFKSFIKLDDNLSRQSEVRAKYTQYFKGDIGINVNTGNFNQKINPIYGQNTKPVQNIILLYGVDFMDKSKLSQYIGSSEDKAKMTRINDSSLLLEFNKDQQAANFIKRKKIKFDDKNKQSQVKIQYDGQNVTRSWIRLESYDLLFYTRELQARYITTDEENNFKLDYKNRYLDFQKSLKSIQNYMIKPGTKEDTNYNQQMQIFQFSISQKRVRSRDKRSGAFQNNSSNGQRRMHTRSRDGFRNNNRENYQNNNRGRYGDRDRRYPSKQNRNYGNENENDDGRRNRGGDRYNNRNNDNNDNNDRWNRNSQNYQSQRYNSRTNQYNNSGNSNRNNRNSNRDTNRNDDQDYILPQYQNKHNNNRNYNNRQNTKNRQNDNQSQELSISYLNAEQKNNQNQKDISLSISQQNLTFVGFNNQNNKPKRRKNSSDPQQEESISLRSDYFNKRKDNQKQSQRSMSMQLSYEVLKKSKISQKNKQNQIIDLSFGDDQSLSISYLGSKNKDSLGVVKQNQEQQNQKNLDITLPLDYFTKKEQKKKEQKKNESHAQAQAQDSNTNRNYHRNFRFGNDNNFNKGDRDNGDNRDYRNNRDNRNNGYNRDNGNYRGNRGNRDFGSNNNRDNNRQSYNERSNSNFNNRDRGYGDRNRDNYQGNRNQNQNDNRQNSNRNNSYNNSNSYNKQQSQKFDVNNIEY